MCLENTYLGPKSSAEHSLRFRDSTLAGSDEFSLTPLILNAYQRLEIKYRNMFGFFLCTNTKGLENCTLYKKVWTVASGIKLLQTTKHKLKANHHYHSSM